MENQNAGIVDLTAFIPQDVETKEIMKPGGLEGTGWFVTFAGPGHPKTIAFGNDMTQKALRRARQIETAQINGRKFKPEDKEVDELRRENVSFIVARIVDWTPVRLGPGEPVAFSEDAATTLLLDPKMGWVLSQMLEFISDERSFTKGSAKASESSQPDTSSY